MLINKHDCYNVLFEMQSQGMDVHEDISKFMKNYEYVPPIVITQLKEHTLHDFSIKQPCKVCKLM